MNEQKMKPGPSLEEVYKLAKDNNRMLRAMRRDAFVGGILKFVFWVAIFFVVPYIVYVIYLQPYLENLQEVYQSFNQNAQAVNETAQNVNELKNQFPDLGNLLKQFGGGGN